MPSFKTATGGPPTFASRSARRSGHRSLPSTVEPSPSVIEIAERDDGARAGRRVDQDLAQENALRQFGVGLEVDLGDLVPGAHIGGLMSVPMDGRRAA